LKSLSFLPRIVVVSVAALAACTSTTEKSEPPLLQDTEHGEATEPAPPPPTEIVGEEVSYSAGDVTMKGYLAYNKLQKGERLGVLVVHEWWGHNEYARKRARMLAEMGYTALAVDMYGDGKQAEHPKDAQKFASQVMGNIEITKARFLAAAQVLENHPTTKAKKIAAIGYCFGGGVVLHMARISFEIGRSHDLVLAGVASFHGSLDTKKPAGRGEIRSEILVLNGEADPMVKPEAIEAFKKEMYEAGAKTNVISYPGALHAFTNPDADALGKKFDLPLAYDEEADKDSWGQLTYFLNELASSP